MANRVWSTGAAAPTKRGHIETLERGAGAVELTRKRAVNARLIPGGRGWLDYLVRLQMQGAFLECVAGYLGEGCFPEWAVKALDGHYDVAPGNLD